MDFPGTYPLMALTSDLSWHCYLVTLGDCPNASDFTVTPAGCIGSDGTICITGTEWLGSTFACSGIPSADGCAVGLQAGISYCLLSPPSTPGMLISYLNIELEVPSLAFSVTITETPYADPVNTCIGASITANVTGGSGPFVYDWNFPSWTDGEPLANTLSIDNGYGYIGLNVTDLTTGCQVATQYAFLGNNCAGYDIDNNGAVNVTDLLGFMAWFGTTSGGCADFDGNGVINISDLLMFLSAGFGPC